MIYRTANKLEGHRIRIECPGGIPTARNVQITDVETGEPIQNVEYLQITIAPRGVIMAHLLLGFVGEMQEMPDGSSQAPTWNEQLTVRNPEIDLKAFVNGEVASQ